MLLRCDLPAVIVFVPFGSAHCQEASRKLDFCFTRQLSESLCSTVNLSRSKTEFRKCVSSPLQEETYKNIFRADVVDVLMMNCRTVTGIPKCCMKPLQSLFSLETGAHETNGSRIRCSHIAFVPQILEQRRDCLQSALHVKGDVCTGVNFGSLSFFADRGKCCKN